MIVAKVAELLVPFVFLSPEARVHFGHNQLVVDGPRPSEVGDVLRARLEELGWTYSSSYGQWIFLSRS